MRLLGQCRVLVAASAVAVVVVKNIGSCNRCSQFQDCKHCTRCLRHHRHNRHQLRIDTHLCKVDRIQSVDFLQHLLSRSLLCSLLHS